MGIFLLVALALFSASRLGEEIRTKKWKEVQVLFIANLKLCLHLTNFGDISTLVIYPAPTTTHRQLSPEQQLMPEFDHLQAGAFLSAMIK